MPLPIISAVAAAGGVGSLAWGQRRLRPKATAQLLATLAAAALAASVIALALLSLGYAAAAPEVAARFQWCRSLAARWVPWWLGTTAIVALCAVGLSTCRTTLRHRRTRVSADAEPVLVLALDVPIAYSLAGRPGQVVVSSGMLDRLDCDERRALFAHEQSHLRNRHHLYLWLAETAAAVPLLRPLRNQIRFAVERWADEDAADQVGDRQVVACALARAALAGSEPVPASALAGADCGVPARVEALLVEAHRSSGGASVAVAMAACTGVAAGGVALVQLQRLVSLGTHLCHL
jgi:hypothetical protein